MSLRSMTGFSSVEHGPSDVSVQIELRSVNHRYLDIVVRLPESHRHHERLVQGVIREELGRGRVEAVVKLSGPRWGGRVVLDEAVVANLVEAARQLGDTGLEHTGLRLADVLGVPGVVRSLEGAAERDNASELEALLKQATSRACAGLVEARCAEGRRLEAALVEVLDQLVAIAQRLEGESRSLSQECLESVKRRLELLLAGFEGVEIDGDRVLQEAAHLADRSDVSEEVARLNSHLLLFRELLGQREPVGRKLDFLCQEILRELNTLATKARSTSVSHEVVEAKALCEQLREQVQNVE